MATNREIYSHREQSSSSELSGTEFDLLFTAFSQARSQEHKPRALIDMGSPVPFVGRYLIAITHFGGANPQHIISHSFMGTPTSEFDRHRSLIDAEEMRRCIAAGPRQPQQTRV